MDWRQKIAGNNDPAFFQGNKGSSSVLSKNNWFLWCTDKVKKKTFHYSLTTDGVMKKIDDLPFHPFQKVVPFNNGYFTLNSTEGVAIFTAYSNNGKKLWEYPIPGATNLHWSITFCQNTGNVYIFYSYTENTTVKSNILSVDPQNFSQPRIIFTVPEVGLLASKLILDTPKNIFAFVQNDASPAALYCINKKHDMTVTKMLFTEEPALVGVTPLCGVCLETTLVLGGYKTSSQGKHSPWVSLFDNDMRLLHEVTLPHSLFEQTVKSLAVQEDGSILALSTPWTIFCINPKGVLTHKWSMPAKLRSNTLTSIRPIPDMYCLIAGNSYTQKKATIEPEAWAARISLNDFKKV